MSWLIQHDVDEGREHVNFSEWNNPQNDAPKAADEVEEGEMPPWYFLPLHDEAQLSQQQKEQLVAGLRATFGDPQ